MKIQEYIEKTVAPKLQGDGGWIEFVSYDKNILTVIFRGECSKCLILHRCVSWLEGEIERDLKLKVQIEAVRKKPYFQR